mmetsp:Transcript_48944/g.97283  ORF Transcript_48944/g.97283 Transcript_48944/m.97283 type:complete len:314 (-) Transcript_48944:37-978(-)
MQACRRRDCCKLNEPSEWGLDTLATAANEQRSRHLMSGSLSRRRKSTTEIFKSPKLWSSRSCAPVPSAGTRSSSSCNRAVRACRAPVAPQQSSRKETTSADAAHWKTTLSRTSHRRAASRAANALTSFSLNLPAVSMGATSKVTKPLALRVTSSVAQETANATAGGKLSCIHVLASGETLSSPSLHCTAIPCSQRDCGMSFAASSWPCKALAQNRALSPLRSSRCKSASASTSQLANSPFPHTTACMSGVHLSPECTSRHRLAGRSPGRPAKRRTSLQAASTAPKAAMAMRCSQAGSTSSARIAAAAPRTASQ